MGALSNIQHLEAGRGDAAVAELDAQVDAGISAHWLRERASSRFAQDVSSPADLVAYLERVVRISSKAVSPATR
jgi:hypothetical protein